jgi:GT2 family glycosyltransferase
VTTTAGNNTRKNGQEPRPFSASEQGLLVKPNLDVSIVIVNWNAMRHLENCLNSLSTPNGYTQEIILVDNASTDGSPEMAANSYPQVKLIRNKTNFGFARANNIGIAQSTGRYVCLVNSDVVVLEDCIKNMIKFLDQNPRGGMAGPRILNPDGTLQPRCRHFPTVWNNLCQAFGLNYIFPKSVFFSEPFMKYWAHDDIRKVDIITACLCMVRRAALNDVGLLDEEFFFYGEDVDWCKRFKKADWDIVFYPHAQAIHFGGASSARAPIRFYIELQKADLRYWRKHHGRIGAAVYAGIVLVRQISRIVFNAARYVVTPSKRKTLSFKLKRHVACVRWLVNL